MITGNDAQEKVGRRCKVLPLDSINGRIIAVRYCQEGVQYFVRYFHNGEAKEVYFYPDEVEECL